MTALPDLLAWLRAWRFWRDVRADWRRAELARIDELRDLIQEDRNR